MGLWWAGGAATAGVGMTSLSIVSPLLLFSTTLLLGRLRLLGLRRLSGNGDAMYLCNAALARRGATAPAGAEGITRVVERLDISLE